MEKIRLWYLVGRQFSGDGDRKLNIYSTPCETTNSGFDFKWGEQQYVRFYRSEKEARSVADENDRFQTQCGFKPKKHTVVKSVLVNV